MRSTSPLRRRATTSVRRCISWIETLYIRDGNSLAICDGSERQAKRRWFLLLRLSCGLERGDWKLSQPHRNGAFAAVAKNGDLDGCPWCHRANLGSKIRAASDRALIDGEDDITWNDPGLGCGAA